MTTYLYAVGRIAGGHVDVQLAPAHAPDASDAYAIGEMDHDDGKACEPLNYYSDLASIEAYIVAWKAAAGTLPPLQDFIDAGAALDADVPPTRDERAGEAAQQADTEAHFRFAKREASDLEDDMADRDFWAHGC